MGDFCQLPPVGERALYDTRPCIKRVVDIIAGQQLYQLFDKTIILTKIMRQQGDDKASLQFREVLSDLRHGTITQDSFDLLSTRVSSNLSQHERNQFKDALRIYPVVRQVIDYNLAELARRKNPVIVLSARHNCPGAAKGTEEEAEGLSSRLYLSIGSRLMITSNLLTNFGLVNGAMGVLHGIVWQPGNDPYTTLPCILLFIPDHYPEDGPCLFRDNDNRPVVPILPITRTWEKGSRKHSRTMFPVVLAYAISIHKSQGLTLKRIVMDISKRDFQTGLTYVGISRVKELAGIMFDRYFDISRFLEKPNDIRQLRMEDQINRSKQIPSMGLDEEVTDN